jgi:hypothetical protein
MIHTTKFDQTIKHYHWVKMVDRTPTFVVLAMNSKGVVKFFNGILKTNPALSPSHYIKLYKDEANEVANWLKEKGYIVKVRDIGRVGILKKNIAEILEMNK